ncbi:hypothetical protein HanRHA438_Chr03g0119921 [Helianthus annuus]|uniref:Uncharacterized protein n=1 Tax=Helianthus annuus TaxID=4232 RepID=A0A251V5N1_HELAN|nr:uncharacterized protein LOC110929175 [Helianthus annuus]KAF5814269.1 hypothetical protein HanXRQr2_Chr03g0109141 [Helianthus annuus]KAJ0600621.1 hypothetical protein HanIR_Chr03g0119161 [Helianthus annuus]KAJ0607921.1 hypothetical protein HanHA89_Chr03g0102861 [Helianthus annuus]KAJ0773759.1 hypothetical protein HanOQP8_Chr03g0103951 [Helianthus annuus]KAJ0801198.1 hypothetical protein HanPI659440_Chr03g0114561 [Helianthus annuus]
MNRRIRHQSTTTNSNHHYLRFLKPGALAQLRDSKIIARSHHLRSPVSQISLHRVTPSSPPSSPSREVAGALTTISDGELPFLTPRSYAPRCVQRKKLMAVRSMCYLSHGSSSLSSDASVTVIDVL